MQTREVLIDLLVNEVLPSIAKFNTTQTRNKFASGDTAAIEMGTILSGVRGSGWHDIAILWAFADTAGAWEMRMIADRSVANLGVSKHAFWVQVLGYTLWQGLRDYRAIHKAEPKDWVAYFFAMLTADDLSEEIRKEF